MIRRITFTAALLLFAAPALAQGTSAERAACTPDAFQFCTLSAILGDGHAVLNCLIANKMKISKDCRNVLAANHL